MDFNGYQHEQRQLAFYPGNDLMYPALGLCGEAGEVAEKVKKIWRDKGGEVSDEDRIAIVRELGDVMWYVSELAFLVGVSLEYVAQENIRKLMSRRARGTQSGSGDNR